jgi:hypothetical protein
MIAHAYGQTNPHVHNRKRVSADPETLRALAGFSEREIRKATGLARRIIRHIRHKGQVKPSTMQRIFDFLNKTPCASTL